MGRGLESTAISAICLLLCGPGAAQAQMQYVPGDGASDHEPLVVPRTPAYLEHPAYEGEPPHRQWHLGIGERSRVLQVYVEDHPAEEPWAADEIGKALDAWNSVEDSPMRFRLTSDHAKSQVRVRWIDRFAEDRAGLTQIETDPAGRIRHATVTLAVHHGGGLPMGPEFIRMVGLHEFGHVLGLPHSEDPRDVMHPGNRNLRLSLRDIGTTRRLYGTER